MLDVGGISVQKEDGYSTFVLSFVLSVCDFSVQWKKIVQAIRLRCSVPGFRVGRVPEDIVISKNKDRVVSEFSQEVLSLVLSDWAKSNGKEIISILSVDKAELNVACDAISYIVRIDIKPDIVIDECKIQAVFEKPVMCPCYKVTSEDLARHEEKFLESKYYMKLKDVGTWTEDNWVVMDVALYDRQGKVIRSIKQYSSRIGEISVVSGFSQWLLENEQVYAKSLEQEIIFPDDFSMVYYRGQKGMVRYTVISVHEVCVPELNDDAVKDWGQYSCVQDLRDFLREDLESEALKRTKLEVQDCIIQTLVNTFSFECPKGVLFVYFKNILSQHIESLRKEGWEEDFVKECVKAIEEKARVHALFLAKRDFIFEKIAQNFLEPLDADGIATFIEEEAKENFLPVERYKERLKTQEDYSSLYGRIMFKRVNSYIVGIAKVEEREVSYYKSLEEKGGGDEQ